MTSESLDPDFFDPDFFEAVYRRAAGDDAAVPWQYARSRELIGEWFAAFDPEPSRRALVVAAGLGDDAAALAQRGLDVTAFDLSPSAVDWARRRHPDAPIEWLVADLLDPPPEWTASFDLVIEVFNVQSIAPSAQIAAARNVRRFVAPRRHARRSRARARGRRRATWAAVADPHRRLRDPHRGPRDDR